LGANGESDERAPQPGFAAPPLIARFMIFHRVSAYKVSQESVTPSARPNRINER
jgi:hypothetical protein